jgi:hypothetical protein
MGRVSADLRLQDRSARARLKARSNPDWRMICEGQHLGYYKGTRGGTWTVRYRSETTARCGIKMSLGAADDVAETILSWKQALDKAMHWLELQEKGGAETAINPDITVAEAVESYLVMRDSRRATQAGRAVRSDASYKLGAHVIEGGKLSRIPLAKLTEADLKAGNCASRAVGRASSGSSTNSRLHSTGPGPRIAALLTDLPGGSDCVQSEKAAATADYPAAIWSTKRAVASPKLSRSVLTARKPASISSISAAKVSDSDLIVAIVRAIELAASAVSSIEAVIASTVPSCSCIADLTMFARSPTVSTVSRIAMLASAMSVVAR